MRTFFSVKATMGQKMSQAAGDAAQRDRTCLAGGTISDRYHALEH